MAKVSLKPLLMTFNPFPNHIYINQDCGSALAGFMVQHCVATGRGHGDPTFCLVRIFPQLEHTGFRLDGGLVPRFAWERMSQGLSEREEKRLLKDKTQRHLKCIPSLVILCIDQRRLKAAHLGCGFSEQPFTQCSG